MALSPSLIQALCALPGASAYPGASLAPCTTIRTGGTAGALVTVDDVAAAVGALEALRAGGVPFCCLGAGSDLLVADSGYPGVVLRLGEGFRYIDGLEAAAEGVTSDRVTGAAGEEVLLTVGGAVMVPRFAAEAAAAGLAGVEFACGIPGSIGGGVATNAGAYGRAFADILTEVQLATAAGAGWVPARELGWEYRRCRLPEGALVTAVRVRLVRGEREAILEEHRSILEMRRSVQPQGVLTFGSTFKNPGGGAAGRLLDAAGLKGERRGGAEVSTVHANFVINLGDASTADVLTLMSHMRNRVHETCGVLLEPEVRLLGADFPWESSAGGSRRLPPADG